MAVPSVVHGRTGWTLLLVWLLFGVVLEGLEGFRWAPLVLDEWRHRLWALAHFHGAALGLLNVVYASWAQREVIPVARQRAASRALVAGSVLLPLGFLLGGVGHGEGDPSLGIVLAPVGAVLVVFAVAVQARAAWQDRAS